MAIHIHIVGASSSGKRLNVEEFRALIMELLQKKMVTFPGTIFVGDVRKTSGYFSRDGWDAILPNAPGNMMNFLDECDDPSTLPFLWFDGKDEHQFLEILQRLPYGEKDICIHFGLPYEWLYPGSAEWKHYGAAIYALTRSFHIEYPWMDKTPLEQELSHFLVFYTNVGNINGDHIISQIKPLVEEYFGPDILLEQVFEDG